uniref:Tyrosine-protein kinase n=1 Tax=Globodera pallida TaxID=36090 RepID=A0A183CJZ3_GLOPA
MLEDFRLFTIQQRRVETGNYHGLLPREDVNELLKKDGDFLIRKSEETFGEEQIYILSVRVAGNKRHYAFCVKQQLIAVDFRLKAHKTIREFIDAYLSNGDSISTEAKVFLKKKIGREKWELAHSTVVTQGTDLGRGTFGVVRRGSFKESPNGQSVQVAIKVVSQRSSKEQIKEFMNEARIMRQFNHRNVIKFHGVALGQEPLMIVMELATNGSLTDYSKKTTRSPGSKLYMCYGAAAGLEHIHSRDIIYCGIAAAFSHKTC